ncbi:type II toxin-antitoxin system RelE/ParE family toxin [Epilithonimonas vandammei]|uniref:type II toxin-antitoxin system RelE/ParE family toxin n=1 Tax=Epilithonimonas vandammei TaxID=2487072 RepID=UPI00289BDFD2|nr:type II toxin-antitoxin system RelE/ParE family toxin [Epilithonimonas vandammei]
MAFKVIISDEAKLDLENSYLHYWENASKKVADNFIKDFRKSIKIISDNPYFKIWFEEFRAKPLGKYPFLVFFSVDKKESTIVIARVFHTSQNTEKYP